MISKFGHDFKIWTWFQNLDMMLKFGHGFKINNSVQPQLSELWRSEHLSYLNTPASLITITSPWLYTNIDIWLSVCFIITQWQHTNQRLIANGCLTTQHINNFIDIPCCGKLSREKTYEFRGFVAIHESFLTPIAEFTRVFSVPYTCSGKLSKEKNFHKFHGFVVIHESFLRKIWGCGTFGASKASN